MKVDVLSILQVFVLGAVLIAVVLAISQDVEPPNALVWVLVAWVALRAVTSPLGMGRRVTGSEEGGEEDA